MSQKPDALDIDLGTITRGKIVRFAGVISDFNPIHYDDAFAQKMGLPSAIAHGPLTVAVALDGFVGKYGADRIAAFKTRLKAPVVPDSDLQMTCDEDGNVSVRSGDKEVLSATLELK